MKLGSFLKYQNIYKDNQNQQEGSKFVSPDHRIKFESNEDLVVMNTSVNSTTDIFHGGCEIVSVSNNVDKVLGYSSADLIGKNINRFLPKLYTEFHDTIITDYLNREDS